MAGCDPLRGQPSSSKHNRNDNEREHKCRLVFTLLNGFAKRRSLEKRVSLLQA